MKHCLLLISFLLVVNKCSAQIELDSVYEYFSCTLLHIHVKKIDGYSYKTGKESPVKIEFTYETEKKDTLTIAQYYFLHKITKGELSKTGEINNDKAIRNIFKKPYYIIGNKYYMKFRAESLSKLYKTLSEVRGHIPCEYHINRNNEFKWRNDEHPIVIKPCAKDDFSYFVGDIDKTVIMFDIHDAKHRGSAMTGW